MIKNNDEESDYESDYSNESYDTTTSSSSNPENQLTSPNEITYVPQKENENRDRSLSLSGNIVYEYAKSEGKLLAKLDPEIELILHLIGKGGVKPCLDIENPNDGFGEVYILYITIGSCGDNSTISKLDEIKIKNEPLYNTILQAISSMVNTVLESNKYISDTQIIPESETHSFFYHYNDQKRMLVKIVRLDK